MEIVYIFTNEAMPGLIKIGRTGDLAKRLKNLSSSSAVPAAFECYYAGEIKDSASVEKAIHTAFDDYRPNPKREFFTIDPYKAKVILDQLVVADVTPKDSPADSKEEQAAIEKIVGPRPPFQFSYIGIPPGAILTSVRDETETAEVIDDKRIRFRGEVTSLSQAALTILHELGYKQTTVQGPIEWLFRGETLHALRKQMESTLS